MNSLTVAQSKRRTTWWTSTFSAITAYGLTVVLCVAFLVRSLRLWEADLTIPLEYSGDALVTSMWIKSVIDTGWYLRNPLLGMPTGLDYYDFPVGDTLHFAVLKSLTLFSSNYAVVLNLYFLLSFPLAAMTALFVFRRFGLSYACSLVGALLFTFLPYHFWRGEAHLFLAAYYLIPLVVMVVLWVGSERPPFLWRSANEPQDSNRPASHLFFAIAICVLVALSGFYYALFTCFFLMVAGTYAFVGRRHASSVVVPCLLIAVILFALAITTLPNQLYWRTHGKNPEVAHRQPSEVEHHSLKIVQLLLPVTGHRIDYLKRGKAHYNRTTPLVAENDIVTLGVVGSAGFLILVGCLLFRNNAPLPVGLPRLAVLNIFAVLLATIGGFSFLVALLLSAQIRAYNRISIFIAFFSLFAVVSCLDALGRRFAPSQPARLLFWGFLGIVLTAGLLDQTTNVWRPDYARRTVEYYQDADFVRQIERSVPPRAMIFQLPYVRFPEGGFTHQMPHDGHLRAYLHSKTLRWSYAAMKGRPGDLWQRRVTAQPVPDMVKALSAAGFSGIFVDRDGYQDDGAVLMAKLSHLLATQPIASQNKRWVFFPMAAHNTNPSS